MLKQIVRFYKTYGLREVVHHGFQRSLRTLFPPKMHFIYARLDELGEKSSSEFENKSIKSYSSFDEIPADVVRELIEKGTVYSRRIANKAILIEFCQNFFTEGGKLWLFRFNKNCVGYVWSFLQGGISRFHLFPIISEDALLLGAEIFPEYRGKGFNPIFNEMVLLELRRSGVERVYGIIEVTNKASIKSYEKTIFHRLGIVQRKMFLGKYLLLWDKNSFQYKR